MSNKDKKKSYVLRGEHSGNVFDISYSTSVSKLEKFMKEMQSSHKNVYMYIEEV